MREITHKELKPEFEFLDEYSSMVDEWKSQNNREVIKLLKERGFNGEEAFFIIKRWTEFKDTKNTIINSIQG